MAVTKDGLVAPVASAMRSDRLDVPRAPQNPRGQLLHPLNFTVFVLSRRVIHDPSAEAAVLTLSRAPRLRRKHGTLGAHELQRQSELIQVAQLIHDARAQLAAPDEPAELLPRERGGGVAKLETCLLAQLGRYALAVRTQL